MQRLSVLVLQRNDLEGTMKLINNVYEVADEIVVGDASNAKRAQELKRRCRKLKKVRFFTCPPMGVADPMRMYGMKKCKNEWILLLDSDETLSDDFKKDIKQLIGTTSADAFLINRITVADGQTLSAYDYLVRLHKKSKTTYMGIHHDLAIIDGKIETLDRKYAIIQTASIGTYASESFARRYCILASFNNRMTYDDLKQRVSHQSGVLGSLVSVYARIKGAKMTDEIGWVDYWAFYKYPILYYIKKSFPRVNFKSISLAWNYSNIELRYFFMLSPEDRVLQLNIVHEIAKSKGITKYLRLEEEPVVSALNKKFINSKVRAELIYAYLLCTRYKVGREYYRHLGNMDRSWEARFG